MLKDGKIFWFKSDIVTPVRAAALCWRMHPLLDPCRCGTPTASHCGPPNDRLTVHPRAACRIPYPAALSRWALCKVCRRWHSLALRPQLAAVRGAQAAGVGRSGHAHSALLRFRVDPWTAACQCTHGLHESTYPLPPLQVNRCLSIKGAEDTINKPHAFEISTTDANMFFIADSDKVCAPCRKHTVQAQQQAC